MRRLPPIFLALALAALGCAPQMVMAPAPAPLPEGPVQGPAAPPDLGLTAPVPLDPAILEGRLDNGFTYLVRANREPRERIELRLAVDAGSVLEDDDQRGLAHLIEHMAFNGTRRFAEGELVDFLESIGMQFGPDVNAATGFDETVYSLRLPAEEPIVERALEVLADWAGGILFEPQALERERGVAVEEWRLGRGAGARIRDRQIPLLFRGSRYAERLPIGEPEILESAPAAALERFYRDWYRPDLMAVVAVGDFDPARMVARIRRAFGGLAGPDEPRPRPLVQVPGHRETLVGITPDPEATLTTVSIFTKLERRPEETVADYRRAQAEGLYHAMLNQRLDELRRRPEPPFLWAGSSTGRFVRSRDVYVQSAGVRAGELLSGLRALLIEIERVDRHGFTAGELERAKKELVRLYQRAFAERQQTPSAALAAEYVRHFLDGEPAPGIAIELELVERYLPTIELAEINRLAAEWIKEEDRVILVSAPEADAATLPSEDELLATFAAAEAESPDAWVDRVLAQPLVSAPPMPGPRSASQELSKLGASEWRLANGVTVVLKPTDFRNDQVLITGFAPGGHSLADDEEFSSARFADAVLAQGGLGEFSRSELEKALAGRLAFASTYIGELEQGVTGSGSPDDLETLLQLVYLGFTAPRADEEAFSAWRTRAAELLRNRLAQPEAVFGDRLGSILTGDHPRRRPPEPAMLEEIDLERALAFHQTRFADATGFTFVLVGSFDPEAARPLVETWLGGLPAAGGGESWRDVGGEPPPGVVELELHEGLEPKGQVQIVLHGAAPWSADEAHRYDSLTAALEIHLRELLREELGATYGVAVGGSLASRPRQRYLLSIGFGCAPDRAEPLLERVLEELERLRAAGFDEATVAKVREQQRRQHEVDLRRNPYWLSALTYHYRLGLDPRRILETPARIDAVTAGALRAAAGRYLDAGRSVRGILLPTDTAGDERD